MCSLVTCEILIILSKLLWNHVASVNAFLCFIIILHYNNDDTSYNICSTLFLNQASAGLWLARAWFLEIVSVRTSVCVCVCVCVCPPPRLLITSGVM